METIGVAYNRVAKTRGIGYHKFIFYQRADGTSFQIHGGGANEYGFSPFDEMLPGDRGFGHITVRVFQTTDTTKIEDDVPIESIFEGKDLRVKFFDMIGIAQGIAEKEMPYGIFGPNSNTLVDTTVWLAGGPAPTLDDTLMTPGNLPDEVFNPGFYSKLAPPLWGEETYRRHGDVLDALFGTAANRSDPDFDEVNAEVEQSLRSPTNHSYPDFDEGGRVPRDSSSPSLARSLSR